MCIRDLASTIRGYCRDRALGHIDTSYSSLHRTAQGCYGDSLDYVPSGYTALTAMLRHLRPKETDVFVDLGCGKGRVLFAVAEHRLRKVIGVELDDALVSIARSNVAKFSKATGCRTPIDVRHLDVTEFDPKEGTIFYMFNPFEYKTMLHVINNIRASLAAHPREVRILYSNPKQAMVLDMQDWLTREGELEKSGIYIWRNTVHLQPCSSGKLTAVSEQI
jgi:SAM-dependent methyltransferase